MQAQNGEDFFSNNGDESQDSVDVSFSENGDTNLNDEQNPDTTVTVNDAPAGSDNDLFINSELEKNQENDSIMVSYNKAARLNPFKPPIVSVYEKTEKPYAVVDNTQFEIIEPPVSSTPDENLTRLLQTQISGIMYDPVSPSAIINFNGTDYFVHYSNIKVSGFRHLDAGDHVEFDTETNEKGIQAINVVPVLTLGMIKKRAARQNMYLEENTAVSYVLPQDK